MKRKSLKKFIPWENIIISRDKLKVSSTDEKIEDFWERRGISIGNSFRINWNNFCSDY